MVKPSFYVCGAGGNVNCPHWDDVNGCWKDCTEYCGYEGKESDDDIIVDEANELYDDVVDATRGGGALVGVVGGLSPSLPNTPLNKDGKAKEVVRKVSGEVGMSGRRGLCQSLKPRKTSSLVLPKKPVSVVAPKKKLKKR